MMSYEVKGYYDNKRFLYERYPTIYEIFDRVFHIIRDAGHSFDAIKVITNRNNAFGKPHFKRLKIINTGCSPLYFDIEKRTTGDLDLISTTLALQIVGAAYDETIQWRIEEAP